MNNLISPRAVLSLALVCLLPAATVFGQQAATIESARELYYGAAYEQALEELGSIEPSTTAEAVVVYQYRAAALMALSRDAEADDVFEALVRLVPALTPEQLHLAPRLIVRFAAARDRLLPQLQLRPSPDQTSVTLIEPPPFYTMEDSEVVAPLAILEEVPRPPAVKDRDLSGTVFLEVDIASDGTVERVWLDGAIHPAYDDLIVKSAMTWRYQPATVAAQPVRFRKVLRIEVS